MPPVKPRRIGLTGDVGSGKSTVRRWLAEQGAATLDADAVVHGLLADEPGLITRIGERFGSAVLRPEGGVDRAALGARVFTDAAERAWLEGLLHPAVRQRIQAWLEAEAAPLQVVEAIYLLGSPLAALLDQVWLVTADREARRSRLSTRGWDAATIAARLAAAPPLAPRLAAADQVIDNSGPWAATEAQLRRALAQLKGGP